jgi:hypothetical protein
MKVEVEDIEGKAGTLRDSKKMIKLQRDRYVEEVTHNHQTYNDQLADGFHRDYFVVMNHRF